MKILIVALDFKPLPGGVAEYTHQIARYLQKGGDQVVVLSKKMKKAKEFDDHCPYKLQRFKHDSTMSVWKRYCQSYKAITAMVKRYSPDVLVSNALGSEAHLCWLVARMTRIPFVLFTYGSELQAKAGLWWELKKKLALKGAKKIFCISSFTQNLVVKSGVPSEKIFVVPGGVSLEDFQTQIQSQSEVRVKHQLKGKRIIFTLGRLVERKGIDTVIKALPRIVKEAPSLVYLIGGEGPDQGRLKRLVKQYEVEDRVIFSGWVEEKEKWRYYKTGDIFVMPCRELENGEVEGFGLVFLEANICGKPVIAGRSGGVPDAVEDKRTGLLVDPYDPEAVASAILYLLNNPRVASRLGENGRKRVIEKFSWERIVLRARLELVKLVEANVGAGRG